MGKKVIVDTTQVQEMIYKIRELENAFEVTSGSAELEGSQGPAIEELKNLYETIKQTEENLKLLMEKTIEFLDKFVQTTNTSDQQNASIVSK